MYTVVGYDKDNDVYVEYGTYEKLCHARARMEELEPYLVRDELRRECSDGTLEPIDWLEIYQHWNWHGEELVAKSYK